MAVRTIIMAITFVLYTIHFILHVRWDSFASVVGKTEKVWLNLILPKRSSHSTNAVMTLGTEPGYGTIIFKFMRPEGWMLNLAGVKESI